jgi:hypothetical protein
MNRPRDDPPKDADTGSGMEAVMEVALAHDMEAAPTNCEFYNPITFRRRKIWGALSSCVPAQFAVE